MEHSHFIILGAGASHDYIAKEDTTKRENLRPPLAKDLLNPTLFHQILDNFSDAADLTASVQSALRRGEDLEEFMLEIKNKGGNRIRQLISLQFYLQKLFHEITDNFGNQPGNNYSELKNKIQDNGGKACIVSFNYDSLFERTIPNLVQSEDLQSYISKDIKVIKLHGSCEWSYLLSSMWDGEARSIREVGIQRFLLDNPDRVFGIGDMGNQPEVIPHRDFKETDPARGRHYFSYPALAIPLQEKHDFVCPPAHISALRASLQNTGKILIAGWKAADQNLLDLLKEEIQHPIGFTIVVGNKTGAKKVQDKITKNINIGCDFNLFEGTFSQFLSSPESDTFFESRDSF